ncbi:unnamed protein product, partial [Mesorhabditis spiculigera]
MDYKNWQIAQTKVVSPQTGTPPEPPSGAPNLKEDARWIYEHTVDTVGNSCKHTIQTGAENSAHSFSRFAKASVLHWFHRYLLNLKIPKAFQHEMLFREIVLRCCVNEMEMETHQGMIYSGTAFATNHEMHQRKCLQGAATQNVEKSEMELVSNQGRAEMSRRKCVVRIETAIAITKIYGTPPSSAIRMSTSQLWKLKPIFAHFLINFYIIR